ncbi:MAG TPA: hypothetical protein VLZ29_04130 [Sulfurimonas sp.]|uniref:hypothetical protein n=1 Tax=Sulfurimonas sp. TaxID=2022749 RepID=UPI002BB5889C|nr:hypothetical protein [Sulfurimonas sp.]HUH42282.1 hypothetical protein [Sulfurimonas sp.]
MSDLAITSEIHKLIEESGFAKNKKLLCPITKIFKMRYPHVDSSKVCFIAGEVLK